MTGTKLKRGKRRTGVIIRCDWCAYHKEVSRKDAKTCSGRCRQRLAFYTRACGYPPDHPPGPMTAQDAIDLEIDRLFRQERRHRQEVKAHLANTGHDLSDS